MEEPSFKEECYQDAEQLANKYQQVLFKNEQKTCPFRIETTEEQFKIY